MLPLLEICLELLLWNISQCRRHILLCLKYPEIIVSLRQTLFLGAARSHLETNHGNMVDIPFQSPIFGPQTA
jgi:hypothetical protein